MISTVRFSGKQPGIYLHYPYCYQKCQYCDFYSIGVGSKSIPGEEELFRSYEEEFLFRLERDPILRDFEFTSFFVGGGTPSKMNPIHLEKFLSTLRKHIRFSENAEFSFEANPGDIHPNLLETFWNLGFGRLNLGVQSFQEKNLVELGRFYRKEIYENVLNLLEKSPIPSLGIDLIYGIPGQTVDDFLMDLKFGISTRIHHLSAYSLTLEKGTEYSRLVRTQEKKPPQEEIQTEIMRILPEVMNEFGFFQYEVSNYSKPGFESHHNLKYWKMEYYMGLGPGAHGFLPSGRYGNPRNLQAYGKGSFPIGKVDRDGWRDELILGLLRIFSPIDLSSFEVPLNREFPYEIVKKWKDKKLCDFSEINKIFQWKKEAIFYLDEYILEMSEGIDS